MDFITVRDLRIKTGDVWKKLEGKKDLVVTSNGRPIAVMTAIEGDNLEMILQTMRQTRARMALRTLRSESKQKGLDKMSIKDIELEISASRRTHKK